MIEELKHFSDILARNEFYLPSDLGLTAYYYKCYFRI